MRVEVAFTLCLLLIFGVYGSREDGFTSDINWNKLTGTWFLAVSTKFNFLTTLYKCHIFAPYNITDKGMQLYTYDIPVDPGSSEASGFVTDVIFRPGGGYTMIEHKKMQWLSPEEAIAADEKLVGVENKLVNELKWFDTHPNYVSTNYEVIINQLKSPQGHVGMWIWTRNQYLSAEEAVDLMNLARNEGANEDLELKNCGDVAPQEYLKST